MKKGGFGKTQQNKKRSTLGTMIRAGLGLGNGRWTLGKVKWT